MRAEEIVSQVIEHLPEAVAAAAGETAGVPEGLVELVTGRIDRLLSSGTASGVRRHSA